MLINMAVYVTQYFEFLIQGVIATPGAFGTMNVVITAEVRRKVKEQHPCKIFIALFKNIIILFTTKFMCGTIILDDFNDLQIELTYIFKVER